MTRSRWTTAPLAAFALCVACGRGAPDHAAAVRAQIQAVIDTSVVATKTQNIDLYMSTVYSGFVLHIKDGPVIDREQLRAAVLRDWSIIPATRSLYRRVDSLSVSGDSAIVYTSQKWDRLMYERDHKAIDTVVTTQDHRETWRRTPEGWREADVVELGGTIMVNGKPYQE